jgi:hypothetical protein
MNAAKATKEAKDAADAALAAAYIKICKASEKLHCIEKSNVAAESPQKR